MTRWQRVTIVALAVSCRAGFDARPDAVAQWEAPVPIPGASSPTLIEENCTMSSSGTELVFTIMTGPSADDQDLFVMTRPTLSAPWSAPQPIAELNSAVRENGPRFDARDLTIYFSSNRTGALGGEDVWVATRTAIGQPWTSPQHVDEVASTVNDKWLSPCEGGHYVMVRSSDLFVGTLGAGPPQPAPELAAAGYNSSTFLSLDCRTLYFGSDRSGSVDLYRAERPSVGAPWSAPVPLDEFNTPDAEEEDPWLSPDGRLFLFSSTASGMRDLYVTTR